MSQPTREQLTEIWNNPGVSQPGHLAAWHVPAFGHVGLDSKPGTFRRPSWDKALLKRAKRDLPNWYSRRNLRDPSA